MSRRYSRSPGVLWRSAGDRVLLRLLDRSDLMILDGSGKLLWELLADPISFDDLVAGMTAHYEVDIALVSGPVARALDDLQRADLIRLEGSGQAGSAGSQDVTIDIDGRLPAAKGGQR